MDELLLCEVNVTESSIDSDGTCDKIVHNPIISGNASKEELIVPDFVTPTSDLKCVTIKTEKDEIIPDLNPHKLLLPYGEGITMKEEKVVFLDSDASESDSQLSGLELRPQKRTHSDSANSTSIDPPKRSLLLEYLDPKPGTSVLPNKRSLLLEFLNSKPGTSLQPTMRERITPVGNAESSSASVGSQDNPNESDFRSHGSEDSSWLGTCGSQEGSRLGEGVSSFIGAKAEAFPSSDELLYCVDCKCAYEGDCPEHGPLRVVQDTVVPSNFGDVTRAARTAPSQVKIEAIGRVVSVLPIPNRTRFGPLEGVVTSSEVVNDFTRPIFKYGQHVHSIDCSDPTMSNWMRFVRRTEDTTARNLDAFQYQDHIFFRSIREILPGEELVVTSGTSQGVIFCEKKLTYIDEPDLAHYDQGIKNDTVCIKCSSGGEHLGLVQTRLLGFQCWCWTCLEEADLKKLSISLSGSKPFECCTCKKTFVRKRGLLDHFRTHTGEKPFSCSHCDQRFSVECALKRHLLTHTGEKPFRCTECDQQFATSSDRTRHMRIHTGEKPFQCSECSQRFNQKVHLQLHFRTHTGEKPFVCPVCNQRFAQNSHYSSHLKTHTGERPYACDECDRRFVDIAHLNRHRRIHTEEKFVCAECSATFSDKMCLENHMKVHIREEPSEPAGSPQNIGQPSEDLFGEEDYNSEGHFEEHSYELDDTVSACTKCSKEHKGLVHFSTEEGEHYWCFTCLKDNDLNALSIISRQSRPFKCCLCRKSYVEKRNIVLHLRAHAGDRPFPCKLCDKGFSKKWDFDNHMRTHSGEKPFECGQCGLRFSNENSLKSHLVVHSQEKPFACTECEQRFSRKEGLQIHMRSHTGEKPYACTECSLRFTVSCALKRHQLTHTGEKPFGCSMCDQQFARNTDLTRHMRTHTGEKPFECTECQQRFSQRIHLKLHIRTHTGEKPFVCSECNQRFSQNTHYMTHLRIHSGEKPYACEVCGDRFFRNVQLRRHMRIHSGPYDQPCNNVE